MYGLEDKDKGKRERFTFDLEKKIKKDPKIKKEMLEKAEKRVTELKKFLREGAKEKDFDQFGILLHGYTALQKMYKKIAK
jgi:hypothetical protein